MRHHHNRIEEILVTVKVMGLMATAVAFGLILTMGRDVNEEDAIDILADDNRLVGEVSRSPTVVVQDITSTEAVTLTPTPGSTEEMLTISPATDPPQATLSDTAADTPPPTPTSTDPITPLPTLTFTVFPVTLTDTPTPTEVPCEPMDDWVTYTVQSDETLYDLAVQFQTSVEALQRANCLPMLDLQGGQTISVPSVDVFSAFSIESPQGCDKPKIRITSPVAGETVADGWEIVGEVDPPDFGFYRVQIRGETTGQAYETLFESDRRVGDGNRVAVLNFPGSDGAYWLRVQVYDSKGQDAGGCAVCVSFGGNSGNCNLQNEKPPITTVSGSVPSSVAGRAPSSNTSQSTLWSNLQGCSPTGTGDDFPTVDPLGSGYVVRQELTAIHSGIDLSISTNTPVLAAGSGSVVFAGWSDVGYGNTIVIAHRSTFTLYAHLNSFAVSCGQAVSAGQTIGAVGTTGRSSGPHLHFEIRDASGVAQNPRGYLDFPACVGGWC